ncbi:hypothetical protein EJB05_16708, partial [Eragrostis curvula]
MALVGRRRLLVRLLLLAVAAVASGVPAAQAYYGGLAVGFYNETCPQAEDLVLAEMRDIVGKDKTLGPALLRFMLHDCFVRSNGPWYQVETGRRDGKVSTNIDANNDLPGPNTTIVDLKIYFSFKGLGWKDIVVLSGSHTIGRAQCSTFAGDRLYNYTGRGVQDPTLNKTYAADLRMDCEPGLANDTTMVEMDPASPYTFDLSYYRDVYSKKGLFTSDQALLDDKFTREYVARMAAAESPDEYFRDYAEAMTNMGRIEVLTGDNGEIRDICGAYVD